LMKKILLLFAVFFLSTAAGAYAQTCPSPTPSCSTSSSTTLADLDGTYVCVEIKTNSSNVSGSSVAVVTLNGTGDFTVVNQAQNNDSGGTTTYSDFAASVSGTYCLNTAGNGYLFITNPAGGCPLAMVVDNSYHEVRIINTAENYADALLCTR
jgi:hypothetical protein